MSSEFKKELCQPFDYNLYKANPKKWTLYTEDGTKILVLFEDDKTPSGKHASTYPLHGTLKSDIGQYFSLTWRIDGVFSEKEPAHCRNITYMMPDIKAETKVVKHFQTNLRNCYYLKSENRVLLGKVHQTLEECKDALCASLEAHGPENIEHLGVFCLEDQPQIKEILIAKGLTEIIADKKYE